MRLAAWATTDKPGSSTWPRGALRGTENYPPLCGKSVTVTSDRVNVRTCEFALALPWPLPWPVEPAPRPCCRAVLAPCPGRRHLTLQWDKPLAGTTRTDILHALHSRTGPIAGRAYLAVLPGWRPGTVANLPMSSARAQVIWSSDAVAEPAAAPAPGKTRSDGRDAPGASQDHDQLRVIEATPHDYGRMAELLTTYASLRLQVVDACVIALAERLGARAHWWPASMGDSPL